MMILSEYKHTIDAKGRMTMPAKFRAFLGEVCYVSRGMEGCLQVHSEEGWEAYAEEKLSSTKDTRALRKLQRSFFSKVAPLTYDKQGRILIPTELRELAGLEKEVMVIGVGDHAEIWDKGRWEAYDDVDDDELADLMDRVMEDRVKE